MFVGDTTDVELRVAAAVLALIVPMRAHLLGFVECHRNKRDQSCGGHWQVPRITFSLGVAERPVGPMALSVWECDAGAATTERCINDSDDGHYVGPWCMAHLLSR